MKKSIVSVVCCVVLLTAGCGSLFSGDSETDGAAGASGEPVTLPVRFCYTEEKGSAEAAAVIAELKKTVADFMSANPLVTVEATYTQKSDYVNSVQQIIGSGAQLNGIVMVSSETRRLLYAENLLQDMTSLISNSRYDIDLILPDGPNGERFCIPDQIKLGGILCVNKTLLKAVFVEEKQRQILNADRTLSDLDYDETVANWLGKDIRSYNSSHPDSQIKTILFEGMKKTAEGKGDNLWTWTSLLMSPIMPVCTGDPNWIIKVGVPKVSDRKKDFYNTDFINALKGVKSFLWGNKIDMSYVPPAGTTAFDDFLSGKSLFYLTGSWDIPWMVKDGHAENIAFTALPSCQGEQQAYLAGSRDGYGITKTCYGKPSERTAAMNFLDYLYRTERINGLVANGSYAGCVPVIRDYTIPDTAAAAAAGTKIVYDLIKKFPLCPIIDNFLPYNWNDSPTDFLNGSVLQMCLEEAGLSGDSRRDTSYPTGTDWPAAGESEENFIPYGMEQSVSSYTGV